jgi:hypothetical protein
MALRERWTRCGLALALAVLCGPESLIPTLALLLYANGTATGAEKAVNNAWRVLRAFLAAFLPALAALALYYGPGLWQGLLTIRRSAPTATDVLAAPILLILIALAAAAWWRANDSPEAAVLAVWIALYVVIVALVLRTPTAWSYIPILGPAALLAVYHFERFPIVSLFSAFMLAMALLFNAAFSSGPLAPDQVVQRDLPAGWRTAAAYSRLAALRAEAGPGQALYALDGELQPEIKAMLERGDRRGVLIRYAPEVIVLNGPFDPLLEGDALVRLGYQTYGATDVWRRVEEAGRFVTYRVATDYGPHMRLETLALDKQPPAPGDLLRLRLDWQMTRAADARAEVLIEVRLRRDEQVLATVRDVIGAAVLPAGSASTYHALRLPPEAGPGAVTVEVGVRVNGGWLGRERLLTVR